MKIVDASYLVEKKSKKNNHIIDLRSVDSFNGWINHGESRNGHITGAQNLPFKWLGTSYWNELLFNKEIQKNQSLILYGANKDEISETASWFASMGYQKVSVYYDFVEEWTGNATLPMTHLPLYEKLVPANYVYEVMGKDNTLICHCHFQNIKSYNKAHIPGAIELDTMLLEASENWNRRSPEELEESLRFLGITNNSKVILYGEHDEKRCHESLNEKNTGQLAAFRCALILIYCGVKDVRVLNGGLTSWINDNYPLSTERKKPRYRQKSGCSIPEYPGFFLNQKEVHQLTNSHAVNIISVRSWSEFIGKDSGYSYITCKGRIPNSIFSDCGIDAYHMEKYRDPDQGCRDYKDIQKMWAEVRIDESRPNVFYCGTGWKASEAWFHAYIMGWENISVYDGGWFEWSGTPDNAIETGIPDSESL